MKKVSNWIASTYERGQRSARRGAAYGMQQRAAVATKLALAGRTAHLNGRLLSREGDTLDVGCGELARGAHTRATLVDERQAHVRYQ